MKNLPLRLKALRGDHTQAEFAEIIGISTRSLSRYETGSVLPDLEFVSAISAKTGVRPQWLIFGEEPMRLGETISETKMSTPPMPQNDEYEKQVAGLWERIAVLKGENIRLLEEIAESRKEVADALREVAEARQNIADIRKEVQDEIVKAYKEAQGGISKAHKDAMEMVRDFALKGGTTHTNVPVSVPSAPSTSLSSKD